MMFWIVALAMGLGVAALLARAILVGRAAEASTLSFDLQVYRDQLKEIERDAARGVIATEEAERLRTEVARRILAADAKVRSATTETASGGGKQAMALVMALLVVGGGLGVYAILGAPGYPDLPLKARIAAAEEARENRPSQAMAEAGLPPAPPVQAPEEYTELVIKLRAAVEERPDDLKGHQLLARSEAALGNYDAAHVALARVVALKGAQASAKDHADLADMRILAAGGYVSPEAQAAIEDALAIDPRNGVARYYGGLMMMQTGRPDIAFRMWDKLLQESRPDAPWVPPISQQMEDLAFLAGVQNYRLPEIAPQESPRGPTRADMDAAAEMSPEERADMIRGMVEQLSARMAEEGGPPQDWARLITALGVLGESDRARAIWQEGMQRFADQPDALELLKVAGEQAGVAE